MLEHVWNARPGGVDVAVPGHALSLLRGEVSRSGGDLPTLARDEVRGKRGLRRSGYAKVSSRLSVGRLRDTNLFERI